MTSYPAPGFQFTIRVLGLGASLQSASAADGSFQEVTGLEAQREVETIQAGGVNGGVLQLPKGIKFPNLVLRRGYITAASFLSEWAAQTVGSDLSRPIFTQDMLIQLLGADQSPVVAWNVQSAWPVRWQAGPLDAMKNEVLTEVMEFAYASITRVPLGSAANMAAQADAMIS